MPILSSFKLPMSTSSLIHMIRSLIASNRSQDSQLIRLQRNKCKYLMREAQHLELLKVWLRPHSLLTPHGQVPTLENALSNILLFTRPPF